MSSTEGVVAPRRAFGSAPATVRLLVVGIVGLAVVLACAQISDGVSRHGVAGDAVLRLALLLGCGILFEELTRRVGRLRLQLYATQHSDYDMTSVWTFCAALVLPTGWAAVVVVGLLTVQSWRQQLRGNRYTYRRIYTMAAITLNCLAVSAVFHAVGGALPAMPMGAAWTIETVAATIVYLVLGRALIVLAIAVSGGSARAQGRLGQDDLLEVATVCLGGLCTVVTLTQPALIVLVGLPMYLLQRAALVHQLEVAATVDAKTGLFNMATWQHLAEQQLVGAIRHDTPLAVLIVDLDRFKTINDVHGHLHGDRVLSAVAARLTSQLRESDIVGRFGGEEFVAVMPTVEMDTVVDVVDRLRRAVHDITLSSVIPDLAPELDRRLSASFGVACFPNDGRELTALLHCADLALYDAKRGGRNRAVFASDVAGGPISS